MGWREGDFPPPFFNLVTAYRIAIADNVTGGGMRALFRGFKAIQTPRYVHPGRQSIRLPHNFPMPVQQA
jgi:hypothetical protein